jgi:hypothetical protein
MTKLPLSPPITSTTWLNRTGPGRSAHRPHFPPLSLGTNPNPNPLAIPMAMTSPPVTATLRLTPAILGLATCRDRHSARWRIFLSVSICRSLPPAPDHFRVESGGESPPTIWQPRRDEAATIDALVYLGIDLAWVMLWHHPCRRLLVDVLAVGMSSSV